MKDYAKNYEKASLKDKNKVNSTMAKLCESANVHTYPTEIHHSVVQRMAIDQDPNTAAEDKYYQCVKTTAVQSCHVTPDAVYDHLMRTNKVC